MHGIEGKKKDNSIVLIYIKQFRFELDMLQALNVPIYKWTSKLKE